MTDAPRFRTATVLGSGVIGTSWAALFLAHGLHVTISDPSADAEQRARTQLREFAPTLETLGFSVTALQQPTPALRFEPDAAVAVRDADVVQENAPEQLDLKQQLWQTVEHAAPTRAVLASSSSNFPASEMSRSMQAPGRLIVGHPFNPPHLVPLVEVVPSPATDGATVDRAVSFYTAMGRRPQVLGKEIEGFVVNRLQAALFREAVHLVSQGIVTEQALDDAVTSSIGLRWAVAGPFETFHLGGGPGGLHDFFVHLGPGMQMLWSQLGTPTLDDATTALLSEQAQNFEGSVADLERRRDDAVIRLMRALDES